MSYTVLARRYRSATFDEVVGQNHVAQTLKKAIESGRVAHAYLFTGTRGVGKTSMARILAKALNCEKSDGPTGQPCLACASCQAIARGEDIDVIEIDAASNRGIDNIREIIANAQYRPARARFKIYIIDEVHGLSKDAFNALLKLLEEPPSHVKFILATTEVDKVLPTILSRCQRYDFRNIPTREIAEHLRRICQEEKIQADEEAIMLVAKAGAGSMRDALSLLDRLLSIGEKQLTVATIEQLLGLPRSQLIFELVQAVGEGRVKDVLSGADRMISDGLSPDGLLASLVDHFRNLLIIRTCGPESNLVEAAALSAAELSKQAQQFDPVVLTQDIVVLEELRRQIRQTQAGRALLDATLVRLALAEQFSSIAELMARVEGGTAAGAPAAQKKNSEPSLTPPAASPRPAPLPPAPPQPAPPPPAPPAPGIPAAPIPQTAIPAPTPTVQAATSAFAPEPAPEPAPVASAIPTPAPLPSIDLDEEEGDDDLPRPGKVWTGPSLASMMKSAPSSGTSSASVPQSGGAAAKEPSNIEPANTRSLPAIWQGLLKLMQDHGPGLHALVSAGEFVGIENDQAVIRYGDDQFPKMLGRNGKRELVSDALSKLLGRTIGVRFEVDLQAQPQVANAAAHHAAPPRPQAATHAPRAATPAEDEPERPVAMAAPPVTSTRPTPEQMAEFERDPLIGALMSEFGATIIKISEE